MIGERQSTEPSRDEQLSNTPCPERGPRSLTFGMRIRFRLFMSVHRLNERKDRSMPARPRPVRTVPVESADVWVSTLPGASRKRERTGPENKLLKKQGEYQTRIRLRPRGSRREGELRVKRDTRLRASGRQF